MSIVDERSESRGSCETCGRKFHLPKTDKSPTSKAVQARLPYDDAVAVDNALLSLIEYCEIPDKYAKGKMIEALVILGGQNRGDLREWFQREGSYA